ncbi:hypothetical protein OpiT1DRAFT_04851 [Opitutaceae bacterium TAV1]|nr:hypothetical protein OpiT1DRAFT_04851 [Opitutaceae bacterium TAV1]
MPRLPDSAPAPASPASGATDDRYGTHLPLPLRVFIYCPWAGAIADAADFLSRLPDMDLSLWVGRGAEDSVRRMARLDADWHGESVRCLANLVTPPGADTLRFLPARIFGATGLAGFADACREKPADETWWLLFTGQHPRQLGPSLAPFCALVRACGVKLFFYAFDEASRAMAGFAELAPHLDVLVHDEWPLASPAAVRLRSDCRTRHHSWVANLEPFAAAFNEEPEEKIFFLGSQLGLTAHRQRQIDFLRKRFRDRFAACHDHSIAVADRLSLNRYKVSLCPEGRKFTTPAMSRTHTDRPFWSGCLGMVPVSENSQQGDRLEELATASLIVRYPHGDLRALGEACERALACPVEERRRIHEHFNRHETVGTVVAEMLAAAFIPEGETRPTVNVAT